MDLNPDGSTSERPPMIGLRDASRTRCIWPSSRVLLGTRGDDRLLGFEVWYLPSVHVCEVYSV